MPEKHCFAALAAIALLTLAVRAEGPAPLIFPGAGGHASPGRPAETIGTSRPSNSESDSGLAQPALYQAPERDFRSVQQIRRAAHAEIAVEDDPETELSTSRRNDTPGREASNETVIEAPDGLARRQPSPSMATAAPPASEIPGGDKSVLPSDTPLKAERNFPKLQSPGNSRAGKKPTGLSGQGLGSIVTVASSLAIVLGLFFITAWLMRRAGPNGLAALPSDVFEVLGRAQLNARQQVHLVRCGGKLLLVSVTQDGAETLTEIEDPDEVVRLAGLCKSSQSGSATATFRQILHQFGGQPAEPGFVGGSGLRTPGPELPSRLEDLHG